MRRGWASAAIGMVTLVADRGPAVGPGGALGAPPHLPVPRAQLRDHLLRPARKHQASQACRHGEQGDTE